MNAGEDPHYILRRILRISYEDIGLADLKAQQVCVNALIAYDRLGSPEGDLILAQSVIYIALAPKSNSAYSAYKRAIECAETTADSQPPEHLLNRSKRNPTYLNDHETPEGFSGQNYFPTELARPIFYKPIKRGEERELQKRLEYFSKLRSLKLSTIKK